MMKESRDISFLSTIDAINERCGKFVSFFVIAASLEVCTAVFLRYVLHQAAVWGLELAVYLCATLYAMGGAYGLYLDAHIRLDVLSKRWSARRRAMIDLVVTAPLFFAVVLAVMWGSGTWTWQGIITWQRSGTLWNPVIWPVRLLLPVGAFLLALQGIAKFIRDLRVVKDRTK